MKKISMLILGAAALFAAFSCSKLNEFPVFENEESFVAFEKATYSVAENVGIISIPVTIASIDPVATSVAYTLKDGTAKVGENVRDTNPQAVLTFDGEARTQYINLEIVELPGQYTGDISFSVELVKPNSLKLSAEKSCVITITDNDHPLADILGTYVVTAQDYYDNAISWEMTLTKDATDVTILYCDFITSGSLQYSSWGDWSYVGQVSEDKKTITFACGQKCEAWYATEEDQFMLVSWEPGIYVYDTGNITFTETAPGVWTSTDNIWLYPVNTAKLWTNFCAKNEVWTKK
ncbi:MAG: hypothetical protein IJS66_02300 [Bacteroidales bacterium]|nr:hypothetical protein [Bacteroidales bacterium]